MDCLFRNAQVFRGGKLFPEDVRIRDGRIVSVGMPGSPDRMFDCRGLVLLPGFADVHVHLREPGFSYKETIRTGSLAAARGGYTTVCAMPNLDPAPDSPEHLRQELDIIRRDACIRVIPYGTITQGRKGECLADLEAMAPDVAGFSDDGSGVQNDEVMLAAMLETKRLGKIIAAHCEDNALLRCGYIHDGAYARDHGHRGICSESEWGQIARDLELVRKTGCAYHVCHISTMESVELIRNAKREGLDVSCETAPHYLLLDENDMQEDGRFKMNPPLRSAEDRAALLAGIQDGTIDMIATDHAPHSAEEKSRGLQGSAMGIVGLETAFPLLYTGLVRTGIIPFARLMELLHDAPLRRFGLEENDADFTLFDLKESYQIDPSEFVSMGKSTPFAGWVVYGRCRMTVCAGEIAWTDGTWEGRT
ncbi:MAG: dihydroorotase [Oscillospiraceae bacterium]|nr:dihydroorotase [Oscillospiraceae bacterium]